MSGSSNIKQFDNTATNVADDTTYGASTQLANGFSAGIVPSAIFNKLLFQVSTIAAAIGTTLANAGWTISDTSLSGLVTAVTNGFLTFAGVNAQTGTSYTVLAGDRNKLVTLSNASAVAITFPQAGTTGFTNAFKTRFLNLGAGAVTITPTTSTINGSPSITLTTGQSVEIYSDETNYLSSGKSAFGATATSAPITITAAGSWSWTHGLGAAPKGVQLWLKNITTEFNYVAGDMVLAVNNDGGSQNRGAGAAILNGNTTTVDGRFGSAASTFAVIDRTTGNVSLITDSKWQLVVTAWT